MKNKSILAFYPCFKDEMAGWKYQTDRLLSTAPKDFSSDRYFLKSNARLKKLNYFFGAIYRIIFKKYDFIFFPQWYGLNVLLSILIIFSTKKSIIRISGGEISVKSSNILKSFFRKIILNFTFQVIALNSFDYFKLREFLNPSLIKFLPNTSRIYRKNRKPRSLFSSNKKVIIGMSGILCERKGQLEILESLRSYNFDGHVKLIGASTNKNESDPFYVKRCFEIGNNSSYSFEHTEHVENVENFYSNIDVFILNSSLEGMPNVLIESLSMGVPCIATDIPGISDVIKGNNVGFLYKKNDMKNFFICLNNLISKPKLYNSFSTNALNLTESVYNPNTISKTFWENLT